MKSNRRKYNTDAGFSLVEILVVVGVIGLMASASLFSFQRVRSHTAISEAKESVLRALEGARNRAITGIGTLDHGVHVENNAMYVFEGDAFTGNGAMSVFSAPAMVSAEKTFVFKRLKGTSNASDSIVITSAEETAVISVLENGAITVH